MTQTTFAFKRKWWCTATNDAIPSIALLSPTFTPSAKAMTDADLQTEMAPPAFDGEAASSSIRTEDAIQSTIDLWELSETQQLQLRDLQNRLRSIQHWKNSPDTVVRFLRARPGDLDAAETMFRNMIQWRSETGADTILEDYDPPKLLREYFPGAVLKGLDREGDPIYVGRVGVTDRASRGNWVKEYEKIQGKPVRKVTIIEDLEGLSLLHSSTAVLSLYGKIMRLDQDNYCETGKRLIILRAPFVFRAICDDPPTL